MMEHVSLRSLLFLSDNVMFLFYFFNFFVVDNCTSSPCLNQGTCNRYSGGYNCSCPPEYFGDNCETCKFKQYILVSQVLETFKLQ